MCATCLLSTALVTAPPWGPPAGAPVAGAPPAGAPVAGPPVALAGRRGWAGRHRTARMAPTAATPPATRTPIVRPCRNALVDASRSAPPSAGWPWLVIEPAAV